MKEDIVKIVADYLDVEPASLDETKTLEDLKIDSLDFIEILFEVEEKYDASLSSEMQKRRDEIHNFGDILRIVEELIVEQRAAGTGEA